MRKKWLFIILLLALFLRIFRLDKAPLELFGDELDVGYQAYSLLKTGRDYRGQSLPTYIHSLTEWRAPLLMYVTIPTVAVFGLNEWGVRLPPVIFGTLMVLMIYLLVKELFSTKDRSASGGKSEGWALGAAFLLAINPWNLHYSRASFEVTLLLFLFLTGAYCFLRGLKDPRFFLGAAISFGLTPYTYSTANLFLPLLLLSLVIIYRKEIWKLKSNRIFQLSLIIFLVILIPIGKQLVFGEAGERFGTISVFSDSRIIEEIHWRRLGGSFEKEVPKISLTERLFTNRPVYWGLRISRNYLAAFSPEFLFATGDAYFRHSISKVGEFYLVEIFFIILGIWAFGKIKGKEKWLVIVWLFFAPLPTSLTKDGANHATRLFLMGPMITVLSAYGLVQIIKVAKKKKTMMFLLFAAGCLLVFNFAFYLHRYFVHYPRESWRYWHYGYKEGVLAAVPLIDNYERVIFTNASEPVLLRFLFWTKYDPAKFQKEFIDDKIQENILPGLNGFRLGEKFYFGALSDRNDLFNLLEPKTLYFISQEHEVGGDWDWRESPPGKVEVLKTVLSPYQEPIFYLVTGKGGN